MPKHIFFGLILFLLWTGHASPVSAAPSEPGRALIGSKAKAWQVGHWINSEPLRLEDLAGKVVLVRFWTGPGCPFCSASAPALNEFYKNYHARGLEVLGFYHHKAVSPLNPETVADLAERFGFRFPVAIDEDWKTLQAWWPELTGREWTSVTFLINQQGVIHYIHPGGQYVKGDADYALLKNKIEALL